MKKARRVVLGPDGGVGMRKILKVGGSQAICLPKEFLLSKGLKTGDEVALIWNGGLRVFPVNETKAIDQSEEDKG